MALPTLSSVLPIAGPSSGGDLVRLVGAGAHETYCKALGECRCDVEAGRRARTTAKSLTLASGVTSAALDDAVLFIVEIDDIGHAGFQKASGLSVEVANVQYFEGGSLIPNKSPGRLTFSDVTLERGATEDRDLFDWFQDVAITSSGLGLTDVNYKRNLDIVQQDRDGTTLRRWSLSRAWPTKFVAGEWDNESDENVIESVTLTYDFFELMQ